MPPSVITVMKTVASQMRWPLAPSVTMTTGNSARVKSHFGELEQPGAPRTTKRAPKIMPAAGAAPGCIASSRPERPDAGIRRPVALLSAVALGRICA